MSALSLSRRGVTALPNLCVRCSRISTTSIPKRWNHIRPTSNCSPLRYGTYGSNTTRSTPSIHNFPPPRRRFSTSPAPHHGDITPPKPGQERHITFIDQSSTPHTFTVADGDNLLDIAQHYELDMEGACGGSCACSTCHVIVSSEEYYDKMAEPSDDENDMLDLAFGLTETSRLGCQIQMSKELDGLEVQLPAMTRNLQASDFAKKE